MAEPLKTALIGTFPHCILHWQILDDASFRLGNEQRGVHRNVPEHPSYFDRHSLHCENLLNISCWDLVMDGSGFVVSCCGPEPITTLGRTPSLIPNPQPTHLHFSNPCFYHHVHILYVYRSAKNGRGFREKCLSSRLAPVGCTCQNGLPPWLSLLNFSPGGTLVLVVKMSLLCRIPSADHPPRSLSLLLG